MSFFTNLKNKLPIGKNNQETEHFFAVNIGPETVTSCLWTVKGENVKVINPGAASYEQTNEIVEVIDGLLDKNLGEKNIEPEKILFGVPEGWLTDDELKEPYLKVLREIVKSLEVKPLAYVSTPHALTLYLEKKEGSPVTAILVGLEEGVTTVTVVRAGKLDGTKVVKRADNLGEEIEKALLTFTEVEVLPSRILIYGQGKLDKPKATLLAFPWMNELSFLHFPKVESLDENAAISSICLAGAIEVGGDLRYKTSVEGATGAALAKVASESLEKGEDEGLLEKEKVVDDGDKKVSAKEEEDEDLGFVAGDITKVKDEGEVEEKGEEEDEVVVEDDEESSGDDEDKFSSDNLEAPPEDEDIIEAVEANTKMELEPTTVRVPAKKQTAVEEYDFDQELEKSAPRGGRGFKFPFGIVKLLIPVIILAGIVAAYFLIPKAEVLVFVEPRILERDTQVTVDPNIDALDEANKKIPGEIVEAEVSGSGTDKATGKKQVGNPAKGTVVLRNKTDEGKTFSKGTKLLGPNGLKFTLDNQVQVASRSAEDGTWGKGTADVTADSIGPDSNLPSGTDFTVEGQPSSSYVGKSEGNFSGGTSKDVTIVTDADQKRLLAKVASELRGKAQTELQTSQTDKKVLEEALTEEITKKVFSKNINDQASEFSLNLTATFKGTAYSEADLKNIVSKLVETNVPADFQLNLAESETQSDVSKVEKDGRVIFTARFKAKLTPKIDSDKIRKQIRGKTPEEAAQILKGYENVLGSEIKLNPSLPKAIARLPFFENNIKVEVGLK